jgi:P4 family phage/plasmid primase-like protien
MAAKSLKLELFDDTTYEPARLMYWPSSSCDAEFVFKEIQGKFLDPDEYPAEYKNWHDVSIWPTSKRQSEIIQKQISAKQADPLAKKGVVGAFCRVYSIESAIETFLSEVYKPSEITGRYDYISGQSCAGLVVYEGIFAYSHHATDPASGRLLNAFDLVRIHKFGDLEEKASFNAMCEFAIGDKNIKYEMSEESKIKLIEDFGGKKDKFPFIVSNKNGGASVSPPRLAEHFRNNNQFFLTKGQSGKAQFWVYDHGIYSKSSENEIMGVLSRYVAEFSSDLVRTSSISEAYRLLSNDDKYLPLEKLNENEDIIVFENGLYDISTGQLLHHHPDYFGTVKLPANWNPNAGNPKIFNKFLDELVGGDSEKQQFLKEFIGMAFSNIKGFKTKKALFLLGEKDSGKSQLRALVEQILGIENCTSIDLLTLERRFGTGLVFGKRLVGSNDLGFADIPELRIFKQLTGGDSILMENKFADGFTARYNGVLWFSMNKLPNFGGDRGNAVLERIVIIKCGKPCPIEKQDRNLVEKMFEEREAIIRDCIYAAAEVVRRGYRFTIPEASKKALAAYELELSPVKNFLSNHCAVSLNKHEMLKSSEVYGSYCRWCHENGYKSASIKNFICEAAEWASKLTRLKIDDFITHKKDANYYPLKWKVKYSEFL